jgi:hypothetical protein
VKRGVGHRAFLRCQNSRSIAHAFHTTGIPGCGARKRKKRAEKFVGRYQPLESRKAVAIHNENEASPIPETNNEIVK